MSRKNILVVAPHMDDESLGCAGAIARHKKEKDRVTVIFIACRVYGHRLDQKKNELQKTHALKAKSILKYDKAIFLEMLDERLDASVQDIIIPLEKYFHKIKPNVVYIPFSADNNQDHRAVFDALRVVLRPAAASCVEKVLMYEVPSSTEQSPPLPENAFLPNYYIDISSFIESKIKACECYRTEKRLYPHPRSAEAIRVLAKKRGTEIGFRFAEAFMLLREKRA
jgi:LmbE family N-acetylglucosaminyl deacetylase